MFLQNNKLKMNKASNSNCEYQQFNNECNLKIFESYSSDNDSDFFAASPIVVGEFDTLSPEDNLLISSTTSSTPPNNDENTASSRIYENNYLMLVDDQEINHLNDINYKEQQQIDSNSYVSYDIENETLTTSPSIPSTESHISTPSPLEIMNDQLNSTSNYKEYQFDLNTNNDMPMLSPQLSSLTPIRKYSSRNNSESSSSSSSLTSNITDNFQYVTPSIVNAAAIISNGLNVLKVEKLSQLNYDCILSSQFNSVTSSNTTNSLLQTAALQQQQQQQFLFLPVTNTPETIINMNSPEKVLLSIPRDKQIHKEKTMKHHFVLPKPNERETRPNSDAMKTTNIKKTENHNVDLHKKIQRRIKNRQSAQLSRTKKKQEYENTKRENINLKKQLDYFKENCRCGLNINNSIKNDKDTEQTVLSAMKTHSTLLLMLVVVSINCSSINLMFRNTTNNIEQEVNNNLIFNNNMKVTDVFDDQRFRRKLLSINDSDIPSIIMSTEESVAENNRDELISPTNVTMFDFSIGNLTYDKCSTKQTTNKTENMRLASELKKWIECNGYINITSKLTTLFGPKTQSQVLGEKLSLTGSEIKHNIINATSKSEYNNVNSITGFLAKKRRKQDIGAELEKQLFTKQQQHRLSLVKLIMDPVADRSSNKNNNNNHNYKNTNDDIDFQYLKLFNKIKRKDDTFYVLSFNSDNIILPASQYNNVSRPKIALMFPRNIQLYKNADIASRKVSLMQIDCEVVNTTMLEFNKEIKRNVDTKNNF